MFWIWSALVGTAGGGVWKSVDGGLSYQPIFDVRTLEPIAVEAPLLLVLDDLQWADDASLEFLHHLAQAAESVRRLTREVDLVAGDPSAGPEDDRTTSRILAMTEGALPYELTKELDTVETTALYLAALSMRDHAPDVDAVRVVCLRARAARGAGTEAQDVPRAQLRAPRRLG